MGNRILIHLTFWAFYFKLEMVNNGYRLILGIGI